MARSDMTYRHARRNTAKASRRLMSRVIPSMRDGLMVGRGTIGDLMVHPDFGKHPQAGTAQGWPANARTRASTSAAKDA